MKALGEKLSYANVVSTICLFLLLGGAAFAATKLPKNSVGTKQLKNNSVTTAKIKNGAVTGAKVQASSLGTVPSAASANNASHAADADSLGGQPAASYAKTNLVRSATIGKNGLLVPSLSSGIAANQFVQEGTGFYCFHGLNPAPTTAVASISAEVQEPEQGATAATSVNPSDAECQVQIDTYNKSDEDHSEPFSVIIR